MALKHMLKHTETEAVLKCYVVDSAGGNIDISLQNDLTRSTQVYVTPDSFPNEGSDGLTIHDYTGSRVYITGIWWGVKKDKLLDITRIVTAGAGGSVHSHYYLTNSGFYDYTTSGGGFADRCYAQKDIRLTFDGSGHCIIRLRKEGWADKIEPVYFGSYDDPTVVGS